MTPGERMIAFAISAVTNGPLSALAYAIFVRRALRDALVRTVRRFAVEAEDEAGLR